MHWHGQLSPQRRPPLTPSIGLHRCAEAPEMRLWDRGRAGGPRLLCRRTPRHRIEALIHPDNVASMRLVDRLGFHCEGGPLRDYWRVGDGYASVMIYARINHDC